MSQDSAAEQRAAPAATVIVVDADARTVLLMRRPDSLRFMGGFWVFPGGAVDPVDLECAGDGASPIEAAAHAACRELHEEAGLKVYPEDLVHWAHWITPSAAWRRFDTHFFVAFRPADQQASVASAESVEFRWVDPDWAAGGPADFPVTPPTVLELRLLAPLLRACADPAAFRSLARGRCVRTVLPKLRDGLAVMPWDAEYDALPGRGVAWDAAACAERSDWPSRYPAAVRPAQ